MLKSGTSRAFTQLDMDMFETLIRLTGNEPLREICERLYYRTKRIWIKSALEVGDMEVFGNIWKAHISISFQRLLNASTGTTRP